MSFSKSPRKRLFTAFASNVKMRWKEYFKVVSVDPRRFRLMDCGYPIMWTPNPQCISGVDLSEASDRARWDVHLLESFSGQSTARLLECERRENELMAYIGRLLRFFVDAR